MHPRSRPRSEFSGLRRRSDGLSGLRAGQEGVCGAVRSALRAFLLCGVLLVAAMPAAAQITLEEAEARYGEQLEWYRYVLEQRAEELRRNEMLLERFEDALAAGNQDAIEEARRRAHGHGLQLMRWDNSAREAATLLEAAAQNLLDALDAEAERLEEQIDRAILPLTRSRLQAELQRAYARYREVERESGAVVVPPLMPVPELSLDARDTEEDIRAKAAFMESRAILYDTIIVSVDRELARLERRLRMARGADGLMTDIGRFDDDILRGGVLPGTGGLPDRTDPDSPIELSELSLPDQIVVLRHLREQAEEFRDLARERAQLFRARIGGIGASVRRGLRA
jgi:hypothetical protein